MTLENIFEAYQMRLQKNFAEAVFDMHDSMAHRIFTDNKDINGNKPIKYYENNKARKSSAGPHQ